MPRFQALASFARPLFYKIGTPKAKSEKDQPQVEIEVNQRKVGIRTGGRSFLFDNPVFCGYHCPEANP
jgi:hypothetical protein